MHDKHKDDVPGLEHTLHVENWLSTVQWTEEALPSKLGLSLSGEDAETLVGDDVKTSADDPEMVVARCCEDFSCRPVLEDVVIS